MKTNKCGCWILTIYILSLLLVSCKTSQKDSKYQHIERTLRLEPHEGNFRNSEGDFIWLNDGRLLFVYSHFTLGSHEFDSGYLAGRFSADSGKTWSSEDQLVLANEAKLNTMSVSLLRRVFDNSSKNCWLLFH